MEPPASREASSAAAPSTSRPTATAPLAASKRDRSLLEMMAEAKARLQNMEISCREMLHGDFYKTEREGDDSMEATARAVESQSPRVDAHCQIELLQIQVEQLKLRLVDVVHAREDSDAIFQRAMAYAAAKGTANAVLHTLFDQASAGKCQVLEQWFETGVIPTRDGLKHWRLDLREIRNETGATILHVAVDASIARQNLKVKLVELLVDRVGFDVNVRDAFGRTALHVASLAGQAEVTQALLARGADASLRDRAGLTALSVVRTLSRPPEEVVQLLANAETEIVKQCTAASDCIPPNKAIASAIFLRVLSRFVRPQHASAFTRQTSALVDALLNDKYESTVAFDEALRDHVPLLFETHTHPHDGRSSASSPPPLVRLDSLFLHSMFWDPTFVDELKLEAAAYSHSLVTLTSTTAAALAGATWEGFVLKLIQAFKLEMAASATPVAASEAVPRTVVLGVAQEFKADRVSDTDESSASERGASPAPSPPPLTPPVRSPIYADQTSSIISRQAWHYAVLFKSATQPFPGSLSVKKGELIATCSVDVARFFPLEERLLIDAAQYHAVAYDSSTRTIQLDREYEGASSSEARAYLAGSCSSLLPPYVATKRIWEREPGNKYEDHMSSEQDLFQDYQFLDPDSAYEVAVKLGPLPTMREARAIVDEWKTQCRKLFDERKCLSGLASCAYNCPQRSGHSLCVETMAAVGRDLAKNRLGRPTFSRQLKPRASLQKYQDLFLGTSQWPGSPSAAPASGARPPRVAPVDSKASRSLDFT